MLNIWQISYCKFEPSYDMVVKREHWTYDKCGATLSLQVNIEHLNNIVWRGPHRWMVFAGTSARIAVRSLRSPVTWYDTSVSTLMRSLTNVHSVSVHLLWRAHWQLTLKPTQESRSSDVQSVINISPHRAAWRCISAFIQVGGISCPQEAANFSLSSAWVLLFQV